MRRTIHLGTALLSVLILCLLLSPIGAREVVPVGRRKPPPAVRVIPPSTPELAALYSKLGEQWWKWVAAIPLAENPIADTTGEFAKHGQPNGEVFLLCGTGGGVPVERTVTISKDKQLFFPLINFSTWLPDDYEGALITVAQAGFDPLMFTNNPDLLELLFARLLIDPPPSIGTVDVFCEIDGQPVDLSNPLAWTSVSGPFELKKKDQTVYFTDTGSSVTLPITVFSDGYWILVDRLPVGPHELHFGAHLVADWAIYGGHVDFPIEVTYHLTVK